MSTRAQQFELLAAGVLYDGTTIATPYAKFLAAGTTTPKNAYADAEKAVAITKKALDAQGRAVVYGDGTYKVQIYSGDPDDGGVLKFEVDNYKVTAVAGNVRTVTAASVTGSVDDSLVECDTTSNDITYTLPDAALMAGKLLQIAKTVAGNTLTVAAAGGQLVNGAASITYTAVNATGVFQSSGTGYRVFQTVGDATTLGGYEADAGTTAETIPVRDVNGDLPGDILGNAATATKVGVLNVTVIEIGDWDMDATASVTVAHGLDVSKIRKVEAMVRDDAGTALLPIWYSASGSSGGSVEVLSGDVLLYRLAGSVFDNVSYNATTFNRGWITVWHVD